MEDTPLPMAWSPTNRGPCQAGVKDFDVITAFAMDVTKNDYPPIHC